MCVCVCVCIIYKFQIVQDEKSRFEAAACKMTSYSDILLKY